MALLEKTSHGLVVLGCAYEITALLTKSRTPTISALCRKHRWLEGAFLAGLIIHFHYKYQRELDVVGLQLRFYLYCRSGR